MAFRVSKRLRCTGCLILALSCACLAACNLPAHAQNESRTPAPPSPQLRVEFLGPEKGFAIGSQSVSILCVIRNVGAGTLPENTARVRCYPLTGLDFMGGQL